MRWKIPLTFSEFYGRIPLTYKMACKMRMIRMRLLQILCLPLLGVALFLSGGIASADLTKYETHGAFTDGDGARHAWSINAGHVLIWDDKPFVPVGGRFQAKFWDPKASDADFDADVAALALLKKSGVTDIYVQPSRGGLTGVPLASIQRLLSHLDSEGFTYGISINDGPTEDLLAYDIRPGRYRQLLREGERTVRFPVENALSGLYFVVGEGGGEALDSGDATMVSEGARIAPRRVPGSNVALLYPRRVYFANGPLGMPNLWDGFDGYRDNLIGVLRKIKLGKGFRFFVDPLPPNLRISEESNSLMPTGAGFTSEWAAWLAKRYRSMDSLETAWGMTDRDIADFKDSAKLLPLWGGSKGIEYLYEPTKERRYRVDTQHSRFWADLNLFKTESLRTYMNELSDILKKTVANVPIVYRSVEFSDLFTAIPNIRGFDGIGMTAYGRGNDLITLHAGYMYAQAAEASKNLWLPVIATADAAPEEKTAPGYASRVALQSDLDRLRSIGARGFYVDGVRLTDPKLKALDLSQSEEQLIWLSEYSKMLVATGVSGAMAPEALFFPRGMQYASLKQLPDGAWWLPTARPSVFYDFGVAGRAYSLADNDNGIIYYLWNPAGKRQIHLRIPKAAKAPGMPPISWTGAANGVVRKDILTLTIGPDPVRLVNYPSPVIPAPLEAFQENATAARELISVLRKRNVMDAGRYELNLDGASKRLNDDNPMFSIAECLDVVKEVKALLQPYAWLEAEKPASHSFDMIRFQLGASGNLALVVDQRPAGSPAPVASYKVNVRTDGTYHIWVSASPGAQLNFRLDDQTLLDEPELSRAVGATYADGSLVWMRLGLATIPKGLHTLEMRADGPAMVDTILLTRENFVPNGITPPPVTP